MAAYEYIALDAGGRQKKGVIEADSSRQIRQILRDQGLVPLSVDTSHPSVPAPLRSRRWRWRRGMSALDLALFTRQMSTLLAASLPIEEALRAVAQQTEKTPRQHDGDGHSQPRARRPFAGVESRRVPERVLAPLSLDGNGG